MNCLVCCNLHLFQSVSSFLSRLLAKFNILSSIDNSDSTFPTAASDSASSLSSSEGDTNTNENDEDFQALEEESKEKKDNEEESEEAESEAAVGNVESELSIDDRILNFANSLDKNDETVSSSDIDIDNTVSLCVFGRYAPFEATILSIALANIRTSLDSSQKER
jgi:hypothetical protein